MNPSELEPLEPREAVEMYLKDRENELSTQSHQTHTYRLERFLEWCSRNELGDMNEVTGRTTYEYKLAQKQLVADTTLKGYMDTLRVFLRFCESIDAVRDGVAESTISPTISKGEGTRNSMIAIDRAEQILAYHSKYEYAKLRHVLFKTLIETGVRMGAAHSIDMNDVHLDDLYIELRHRPETDTTLKNGERGERYVALSSELCCVLSDYIGTHRYDVEDDHGRSPLFSTKFGRINKSTLRQEIYRITRPCTYGAGCPHDRDPDKCDGTRPRTPYGCPSVEGPHAVRRGAITHYLSADVPAEVVSDRMDVSQSVLDEHYDQREESQKMEQRREHLPW